MSRPIKFRAWDSNHQEMYTDDLLVGEDGVLLTLDVLLVNESYAGASYLGVGYEGFVIMQYTGLKDKNGTEIYEGDVVLEHTGEAKPFIRWHVMWLESRYILRALNSDALDRYLSHNPEHMQPEVIGNIYENPNLLEAKP